MDSTRLPGYGVTPETWDHSDSLWWPWRDPDTGEQGSTGSSPASQHSEREDEAATVAEVLRRLAECLELPGRPADYHFIIAGAAGRLYKLRLREPHALREMERLCWLDLELIRARPHIIAPYHEDEGPLHIAVVELLYRLYFRAGDLAEAERVAASAVEEFSQARFSRQLAEARERRAALEAEDG